MKKLIIPFVFAFSLFLLACNNSNTGTKTKSESELLADSLKKEVDDGHNIGMAKMTPLTKAEQQARLLIDSIAKLPAKARQAAAPFKTKLDSLQKDLKYAEYAMDKWMSEYKWDSVFKNAEEKVDYLQTEKLKVTKVKETIFSSLQKADSLLKTKF